MSSNFPGGGRGAGLAESHMKELRGGWSVLYLGGGGVWATHLSTFINQYI